MKKYPQMFGLISLGNQGLALYSYLISRGHKVIPYTTNTDTLNLRKIVSSGKIEGEFEIFPTSRMEDILEADVIFICSITTAYKDVARMILEHSDKIDLSQKIFVLFSGKLGGVLVFDKIFKDKGIKSNIVETDALFACRKISMDTVWIRGIKKWNLLISNQDYWQSDKSLYLYRIIRSIFDDIELEIADNFIQRGLTDFGAMAHAPISLINMSNIDSKRDLLFYVDGVTENTVKIIEKVYFEFNQVARAFNTSIIHPIELLDRYYGTVKNSLLEAIRNVPNYRFTKMPDSIYNRFLYEDVLSTLYPLTLISQLKNVKITLVPSIVELICQVLNIDKERQGRTLEDMDLIQKVII